LQTVDAFALLQQWGVFGESFFQEDDAFQRWLDACFSQFGDARPAPRIDFEDSYKDAKDRRNGRADV
jgi:hypothetical protein